MKTLKTQPTLLSLSIVAALYTPAALALPLTPTNLSAFSQSSVSGGAADVNGPNTSTNVGVSASSYQQDSTGSASGYSFANPSGAYAVSTNAAGGLAGSPANASQAQANLRFVLANSSAIAQNFFLTLKIYGGSLDASLNNSATLVSAEFLQSGYSASVTRLGTTNTTLFSSSADVLRNESGITLAQGGTALTGATSEANAESSGFYSWSTDYYNIDLGVVAAGDSVQLEADLFGFSNSNVGTYSFSGDGCGYEGYDGILQGFAASDVQTCVGSKGQARQFYGDPVDTSSIFSFNSRPAGNSVPEPGSLLLVGAALGALGLARRRRRVSSTI